jgi:hypothetical protein
VEEAAVADHNPLVVRSVAVKFVARSGNDFTTNSSLAENFSDQLHPLILDTFPSKNSIYMGIMYG